MDILTNYDYRLFIGGNIITPEAEVTAIPPLHAKQNVFVKIKEDDYHVVLTGLKFNRKLYAPGTIEAEVAINSVAAALPSFTEVEKLFAMRQVELTIVNIDKATESDNETTIAKNYYVYLINPQIVTAQSKTTMYVKLTINSYDKMMATDKFCKAFTGKKLASEILAKECYGFGLTDNMISADIKNLKNLSYKSSGKDVEKIQPYLVQYNESFYDFLVRTANRCGEFLYFEDGKLTIGLPTTENKDKIQSFTSITMQGYTSGAIDNVKDYSRDSVKDDGTISGELNYDAIETDSAGFPKDTFIQNPYYNSELAGDEYIFPLEDDKYNNLNRELCLRSKGVEFLKTTLLKATSAIAGCEGESAITLAAKEAAQLAADSANAGIVLAYSDKEVKDANEKAWGDNPEHYKDNRLVAFSSLDSNGWIGRDFYADIRHKEDELHKKIVCIDMGTKYAPVKLGERIEVDGQEDDYIVIQINLIGDLVWSRDYKKFDPSDTSTDIYSGRQSQIIWAIPVGYEKDKNGKEDKSKEYVVPPVAPVPMIRKSGPQTAFVIDNDDKKYQGRVRIAYPWQSPKDNKRLELYAAQKLVAEAQAKYDATNAELEELNRNKLMLEDITNLIDQDHSAMKDMTEQEKKAYIEKLEAEISKLKEEMEALEADFLQDHITDNPGEFTDISLEKIQTDEASRKSYKEKQAELEKKELRLRILKDADFDPKAAQGVITLKIVEISVKKQALNLSLMSQKTIVKSLEQEAKEKEEEWNKELAKTATPWVRVATPMATQGGGVFFRPNKGDEVLVNYDSDNIERPYVVGSVFSKNHLAPGEDLDKFAKSFMQKRAQIAMMSANGQHITFSAPSDGWKFWQNFSPAMKTLQMYAPALKGKKLDWGDLKDLCGGIYMGDRFGLYELSLSSHDRKIKIKSPYGNVEIGAFSGINIKAPNGDIKISGKNVTIEAGNKLTLHSGKNIVDDKNWTEKFKDAGKAVADTLVDNTIGDLVGLKFVDMTILRSVLEVFLRPIDGTLMLKSNNYVMLEAGKGQVQVPIDRYAPKYQKAYDKLEKEHHQVFAKTAEYIKTIEKRANEFSSQYVKLKADAFEKKQAVDAALTLCWRDGVDKPDIIGAVWSIKGNNNFVPIGGEGAGTLKAIMDAIDAGKLKDPLNSIEINGAAAANLDEVKAYLQPIFEAYGQAIVALHKHVLSVKTLFKAEDKTAVNQSIMNLNSHEATQWIDNQFDRLLVTESDDKKTKAELKKWTDTFGNDNANDAFMSDDYLAGTGDPFIDALVFKRRLVAWLLLSVKKDNHNNIGVAPAQQTIYFTVCFDEAFINSDDNLKNKWDNVAYLKSEAPQPPAKGFKAGLKAAAAAVGQYFLDRLKKGAKAYADPEAPGRGWAHQVWNETNGQILFSSEKGRTYEIQKGTIKNLDITTWSDEDTLKATIKGVK